MTPRNDAITAATAALWGGHRDIANARGEAKAFVKVLEALGVLKFDGEFARVALAVYADGDKLRILGASDEPLVILKGQVCARNFKGAGLRIACRWKTGARYSEGCRSRKPTLSAGPP